MPNRLIDETSPYLLQHAHNPVDWYPWGEEALGRAKAEDKPILLSVGYSACHWCHVMERESFEDPRIAELMNFEFVCIKVDREERPDVDSIYMGAVQAMTGRGGWPMTVFLTPDGKPFYGGTYYPPEDRHGIPGFPRVLASIANAYRQERGEVVLATERLLQQMRAMATAGRGVEPLTADVLAQAFAGIAKDFDPTHGGIGLQPKFPQPMTYEFLLRYYLRSGDVSALEMVGTTLDRMAMGGIYDQIGGGFHRYSTDTYWLVPHFEKMLYDNALLVRLYLHAYQVTRKPLYRRVVEETLDYVLREMTDPAGGFYSAQDADSEGEEGKFFVWRPEEIADVLGEEDGALVSKYYGVTTVGNFEGRSILNVAPEAANEMERAGISAERLDALLRRASAGLMEARSRRVPPERDDKVLTSWNGLMLAAFAEAGAVLDRDDYTRVAATSASFVSESLRRDGRLLRTHKDGVSRLLGYLEDYAFLIDGLLVLHEATFEASWLRDAVELGYAMVDLFWDDAAGQFYDTGTDHEELVVRPRDMTDNAIPSGSSMAAGVLLKLAVVSGDGDLERRAIVALRSTKGLMERFPTGAGHWLCALDFYLSTPREIALVGDRTAQDTKALLSEVYRSFLPNRVLVGQSDPEGDPLQSPLMEGRLMLNGRATAYVCRQYVCGLPANDPETLAGQLASE